jgi:hypothetical protein
MHSTSAESEVMRRSITVGALVSYTGLGCGCGGALGALVSCAGLGCGCGLRHAGVAGRLLDARISVARSCTPACRKVEYWATWKREFKLLWLKAGLLESSR